MSVYTKVTESQLAGWLTRYPVGTLVELRPIAAGIENTNYFVTTTGGRFVLTLFERLPAEDLPFYLGLMAHLARHGIPCPSPIADHTGALMATLNGKPAALVTRLPGAAVSAPTLAHCTAVAEVLGRMHVAGLSYPGRLENPRGPQWWRLTAPQVTPFLDAEARALLEAELAFQIDYPREGLPCGPIHADLFRDNVLFDGMRIGGVIDFYFAGVDSLLFDIAVTVNDWCVEPDGALDRARTGAFLRAYGAVRAFAAGERDAWPVMLRAAALRFWLSRLYDFHLPRPGELVHAHDPEHFRRILAKRICHAYDSPWV